MCMANWAGRDREDLGFLPIKMNFSPISVAAGLGHSLAICQLDESNGANVGTTNTASWGWNQSSQLERPTTGNISNLIDALDGENLVSVSAERAHSLALTSQGEIWAWGASRNGRLGLASSFDQDEPYYLDSLKGFQILQVVSGFDDNLVLIAG